MNYGALVKAVTEILGSAFLEKVKQHFAEAALDSLIEFLQKVLDQRRRGEGGSTAMA